MTLVKLNPNRSLFRMADDLFGDVFNANFSRRDGFPLTENRVEYFHPAVDIEENDDSYIVTMELPGMTKDDFKIEVKDDVLTISGEKNIENKEEKKNYHYYERRSGKFLRSFRLHSQVMSDKINASYKDGILNIELPKAEEVKPKAIEVKVK